MKGTTYREFESWTDGCKNCTCLVWLPLRVQMKGTQMPPLFKNLLKQCNHENFKTHFLQDTTLANPVKSKELCVALLKILSSL